MTKEMKMCMETWKKHLSDYEFICWDEDRFDIESNYFVKDTYEQKLYAFSSDYIRFYALYNEGGIYLDTDVLVYKSFDDLLDLEYFLPMESPLSIGTQIYGSEKGNILCKIMLDWYDTHPFVKSDKYVGQFLFQNVLKNDFNYVVRYCKTKDDIFIEQKEKTLQNVIYVFFDQLKDYAYHIGVWTWKEQHETFKDKFLVDKRKYMKKTLTS